jgi:hypothetical protein
VVHLHRFLLGSEVRIVDTFQIILYEVLVRETLHPFNAFFSIHFPLFSILNLSPSRNSSLLHPFSLFIPFSSNHTTFISLFLLSHWCFYPAKLASLLSPLTEGGLINYASNGRNFNNSSNAISSRGDFGNPATVRKSGKKGRGMSATAGMTAPQGCQQRQGR